LNSSRLDSKLYLNSIQHLSSRKPSTVQKTSVRDISGYEKNFKITSGKPCYQLTLQMRWSEMRPGYLGLRSKATSTTSEALDDKPEGIPTEKLKVRHF